MSFRGSGQLRHRVTIQEKVEVNTAGSISHTWQDIATNPNVWARKESVSTREFFDSQQTQAEVTVKFTIRHRTDITAGMRIVHKGQNYDIEGPPLPSEREEWMELMCSEGVTDGG